MNSTTEEFNSSSITPSSNSTIEPSFDPFSDNYLTLGILIGVPLAIFILIFIVCIKKSQKNCCSKRKSKLLETYSSINYDDEFTDDDMLDDGSYSTCRLRVGEDLGVDSDYDCMSVDVTTSPDETTAAEDQSFVGPASLGNVSTLPKSFWKR